MTSVDVNTAVVEEEMALTDEVMKEAYPVFYGQIVRTQEFPPKEGSERMRRVVEIYPFDISVKGERGTIAVSIFYEAGDYKKSFTDIHKWMLGLKDQGVEKGKWSLATGHCGWFQTQAGRNGYRGNTFPVGAPKGAEKPATPDNYSFDEWREKFGSSSEGEAETTTVASTNILPESLHDQLIAVAVGNNQGSPKITRLAIEKIPEASQYDITAFSRTLAALVESGRLQVTDGVYHEATEASAT